MKALLGTLLALAFAGISQAQTTVISSEIDSDAVSSGKNGWSSYRNACAAAVADQQLRDNGRDETRRTRWLRTPNILSKTWRVGVEDETGARRYRKEKISTSPISFGGSVVGYQCSGAPSSASNASDYEVEDGNYALVLSRDYLRNKTQPSENSAREINRTCIAREIRAKLGTTALETPQRISWTKSRFSSKFNFEAFNENDDRIATGYMNIRTVDLMHGGKKIGRICKYNRNFSARLTTFALTYASHFVSTGGGSATISERGLIPVQSHFVK